MPCFLRRVVIGFLFTSPWRGEVNARSAAGGRIGDAPMVLLAHFKPQTPDETKAIAALNEMLEKIVDVKEKHKRAAIRPYTVRPQS